VMGSQHRIAGLQQAAAPESVTLLAIEPYLLLISV